MLTNLKPDVYLPTVLVFVILDVWLDSGFNTQINLLTSQGRIRQLSLLILASRGLRLISVVFFIVFKVDLIVVFVAARLLCTLVLYIIASRVVYSHFHSEASVTESNFSIWRDALPYGLSDILAMIYAQIDVTLISFIKGSQSVGYYAPGLSITNAIIAVLSSAYNFFIPVLSKKFTTDTQDFNKTVGKVLLGFFLIGGILWILIGSTGNWIIAILLKFASSFQAIKKPALS